VVCSLQFYESLHRDKVRISRDFIRPVSVTIVLEFFESSDFRQKEENSSEEDFATDGKPFRQLSSPSFSSIVASAARRHRLYHRFKAFRPSPRSSFTGLKRLYPRARSRVHAFFRFATFPKLHRSLLSREVKQCICAVKDVVVFPSTESSRAFTTVNELRSLLPVGIHLSSYLIISVTKSLNVSILYYRR